MTRTESGGRDNNARGDRGDAPTERVPLTHRVNVEPSVLRGMTVTEAKVIASVSIPLFLFLGAALLILTGVWQLLLLLAVFGPLATLWFGSARLQELKRGRPDGYYTQALHLWVARKGLTKAHFITHRGQWSLGRSLPFTLSHPWDVKPSGSSLWSRLRSRVRPSTAPRQP